MTEYRIPVSIVKLIILSCMCTLAAASARAEDGLPAQAAVPAWSVRTEFGGFDISLDPGFSHVASLAVHLAGYSCGGVSVAGDIRADSRNAWPITDDRFQARTSLGIYEVVLSGTIDEARKSATGTWSIRAAGTACSGAWKTD